MMSRLTGTPHTGSIPISRRLRWPLWAVIVTAAWAAMEAVALGLSAWTGQPVTLCLFKRLTGFPCPTCGSGRAVLALLHGDVMQAWLHNPLMFTLGAAAVGILAVGIAAGKLPRLHLSKSLKRWLWATLALAAAANWVYLIIAGR